MLIFQDLWHVIGHSGPRQRSYEVLSEKYSDLSEKYSDAEDRISRCLQCMTTMQLGTNIKKKNMPPPNNIKRILRKHKIEMLESQRVVRQLN